MYNSPHLGIVYKSHYVVQLLKLWVCCPPFPLALELFWLLAKWSFTLKPNVQSSVQCTWPSWILWPRLKRLIVEKSPHKNFWLLLLHCTTKSAERTEELTSFPYSYAYGGHCGNNLDISSCLFFCHTGKPLPWVPEAFHPQFPVLSLQSDLFIFLLLVSSAEQREQNLWYPG